MKDLCAGVVWLRISEFRIRENLNLKINTSSSEFSTFNPGEIALVHLEVSTTGDRQLAGTTSCWKPSAGTASSAACSARWWSGPVASPGWRRRAATTAAR